MSFLIYGANGYTGELIAELAAVEGAKPILAGRSAPKIEPLAAAMDCDFRIFSLDDPVALDAGLEGIDVVIHCAGPFARTATQMANACLRTKTHYLDITGEIEVFEALAARDHDAKDAGVMLLPGAGFDIVPSDCLSAHLKGRMPNATHLTLAIQAISSPSRGTATTMVENIHRGGMIRKAGLLTEVPSAWKSRDFDFGDGPVNTITIPWGDVSTAYQSTGIPNIEVYMAVPKDLERMAKMSRYLGWLLGSAPVQALLKRRIQAGPPGPSDEDRAAGRSMLWGEVSDADGNTAVTILRTPEGYALTSRTAWAIAKRAQSGDAKPGFQTPSMAYGADFILEFDGVERTDR